MKILGLSLIAAAIVVAFTIWIEAAKYGPENFMQGIFGTAVPLVIAGVGAAIWQHKPRQ